MIAGPSPPHVLGARNFGLAIDPYRKLRLLGIGEGHEFHIVWWDPKHEIWPGKNIR
jgi:hypothetical protein